MKAALGDQEFIDIRPGGLCFEVKSPSVRVSSLKRYSLVTREAQRVLRMLGFYLLLKLGI